MMIIEKCKQEVETSAWALCPKCGSDELVSAEVVPSLHQIGTAAIAFDYTCCGCGTELKAEMFFYTQAALSEKD